MNTRQTGQAGEDQAALFLIKHGYKILARNFNTPQGELDLVVRQGNALVCVEVKSRASMAFGGPLLAVTPAKQKRLALAATQYIKANSPKFDSIRFDVVCILPDRIEHVQNAFQPNRNTL